MANMDRGNSFSATRCLIINVNAMNIEVYLFQLVQEPKPIILNLRRLANLTLYYRTHPYFNLNGCVNNQNCRFCAQKHPKSIHVTSLNSPWQLFQLTVLLVPIYSKAKRGE